MRRRHVGRRGEHRGDPRCGRADIRTIRGSRPAADVHHQRQLRLVERRREGDDGRRREVRGAGRDAAQRGRIPRGRSGCWRTRSACPTSRASPSPSSRPSRPASPTRCATFRRPARSSSRSTRTASRTPAAPTSARTTARPARSPAARPPSSGRRAARWPSSSASPSAANALRAPRGLLPGGRATVRHAELEVFEDGGDKSGRRSNVQTAISKYPDLGVFLGLWSYNAPTIAEEVAQVPRAAQEDDRRHLRPRRAGRRQDSKGQDRRHRLPEPLRDGLPGRPAAQGARRERQEDRRARCSPGAPTSSTPGSA